MRRHTFSVLAPALVLARRLGKGSERVRAYFGTSPYTLPGVEEPSGGLENRVSGRINAGLPARMAARAASIRGEYLRFGPVAIFCDACENRRIETHQQSLIEGGSGNYLSLIRDQNSLLRFLGNCAIKRSEQAGFSGQAKLRNRLKSTNSLYFP